MKAEVIRHYFHANWVFWLYSQKRIPYVALLVLLPLLFLLLGAVAALLLQVPRVFAENTLAYSGPLALALALGAYGWFANQFPQMLETLYPALDSPDEEVQAKIQKWARVANQLWIILVVGAPIGLLSLGDLLMLWANPDLTWTGRPWVQSDLRTFFALYYGFFSVLGGWFLLGSGLVGIVGSLGLIADLLRFPVKLEFYRRLRAVNVISLGIAFWTLVAFGVVLVSSFVLKTNALPQLLASSLILSALASAALLLILIAPILSARRAILEAKYLALEPHEKRLHRIGQLIEDTMNKDALDFQQRGDEPNATITSIEVLDALRKERDEVLEEVARIEAIPSWPITWIGAFEIVGAAVTPMLSTALNDLLSTIFPPPPSG